MALTITTLYSKFKDYLINEAKGPKEDLPTRPALGASHKASLCSNA
ncbi:hypothetical protein N9777_03220 [Ascidiaceihabitans sp.]|nr:hypothetical protein [Ascidiaceihabitans sp.]